MRPFVLLLFTQLAFADPPPPPPDPTWDYVRGGVALGAGLSLFAGSLGLAIDAARWSPPADCPPTGLCFAGLDRGLHDTEIGLAVGLGITGLIATVAGALLLDRGHHKTLERRLRPTASGLRIFF